MVKNSGFVNFIQVNRAFRANLFAQPAKTAKFHFIFKSFQPFLAAADIFGNNRKAAGRANFNALIAKSAFFRAQIHQPAKPRGHLQFLGRILKSGCRGKEILKRNPHPLEQTKGPEIYILKVSFHNSIVPQNGHSALCPYIVRRGMTRGACCTLHCSDVGARRAVPYAFPLSLFNQNPAGNYQVHKRNRGQNFPGKTH